MKGRLVCSFYGCNRRWVTNTDRRRCSEHQERKRAAKPTEPTKPAVPHWQETEKDRT